MTKKQDIIYPKEKDYKEQMMERIFERTEKLIGEKGMQKLSNSTVAVFGLGGVGSAATEALARAGIGHIVLVDNDKVTFSNINRQLIATHSTVGQYKVEAMELRIKDINPFCQVEKFPVFYQRNTKIDFTLFDYILDCIDTVDSKTALIDMADICNVPIISSMGTGNRLVADFTIADIYKTSGCPLARTVRHKLKEIGIKKLKTLYSPSKPVETLTNPIASISFVPPVAGYLMAGEVVRDLLKTVL